MPAAFNSFAWKCVVTNVQDGDTIDVQIVVTDFETVFDRPIRIYGMNSREIHSTNPVEKAGGLADKAFAQTLIKVGDTVTVQSFKAIKPGDKYGRWLATITLADGRDFAATMIAAAHAVPYFGGGR